jgi:hemerythrin superfamily protein
MGIFHDTKELIERAKQRLAGILHHDATIFDALHEHHEKVGTLLDTISVRAGGSERPAEFLELRRQLLAHSKAEEKVFYAELANVEQTRGLIDQSFRDHQTVSALLAELAKLEPGKGWQARFEELRQDVLGHVHNEEKVVFPQAREILAAPRQEALATAYREAFDAALAAIKPPAGPHRAHRKEHVTAAVADTKGQAGTEAAAEAPAKRSGGRRKSVTPHHEPHHTARVVSAKPRRGRSEKQAETAGGGEAEHA